MKVAFLALQVLCVLAAYATYATDAKTCGANKHEFTVNSEFQIGASQIDQVKNTESCGCSCRAYVPISGLPSCKAYTYVTGPITPTRVSTSQAGFVNIQPGDLLVIFSVTRKGNYATGEVTTSAAGYYPISTTSFQTGGSDRRAGSLLVKVADGTESGPVAVTWYPISDFGVLYKNSYQVFRCIGGPCQWTFADAGKNDGVSAVTTSLTVPVSPLDVTPNTLSIAGAVVKGSGSSPDFSFQGSISFSGGLGGIYNFEPTAAQIGNIPYGATAFKIGSSVQQTTVSLSVDDRVSGLLVHIGYVAPSVGTCRLFSKWSPEAIGAPISAGKVCSLDECQDCGYYANNGPPDYQTQTEYKPDYKPYYNSQYSSEYKPEYMPYERAYQPAYNDESSYNRQQGNYYRQEEPIQYQEEESNYRSKGKRSKSRNRG
jgi:hypothetical protein